MMRRRRHLQFYKMQKLFYYKEERYSIFMWFRRLQLDADCNQSLLWHLAPSTQKWSHGMYGTPIKYKSLRVKNKHRLAPLNPWVSQIKWILSGLSAIMHFLKTTDQYRILYSVLYFVSKPLALKSNILNVSNCPL